MSTLTKVFTVLLVIFTIFFTALVIQFSARAEEWKKEANDWRTRALAESTKVKSMETTLTTKLALQDQRIDALQAEKRSAVEKLDRTTTDLTDLRLRYNDLDTQLKTQQGISNNLSTQVASLTDEVKRYSERNEALQTAYSDLQRINLDLNQRVKELTTNAETLDAQNKLLTQQNASQQQTIGELQQKLEASGRSTAPVSFEQTTVGDQVTARSSVRAAPIRGQIMEVKGNVASISVGAADGVVPGKVFTVYRVDPKTGGQYLGNLTIEESKATESVGLLSDLQGPVSAKDYVADRLE